MALQLMLQSPDMAGSPVPSAHPTDESVAAYIDAVLSPSERAQLDAHLGDCEYCRSRLVLASRALQSAPVPRRFRRLLPIAATLLAAGIAGVLLLSRSAVERSSSPDLERAAEEVSLPPLHTLQPARGAAVVPADVRFVWSRLSPDALYQVTLSEADGRVLWTERTSDTAALPPIETVRRLKPGEAYFWRVDALFSNLQSVTSGDQQFQVTAP